MELGNATNQPSDLFQQVRNRFETPEHINDAPATAPSKRIIAAYSGYRKVLHGTIAAQAIGVEKMKLECPHFSDWLNKIAAWTDAATA